MSISLLQKYECNKLENIVGNKKAIFSIKEWLDNYYESKKFLLNNDLLKKSSKGRKKKLVGITDHELLLSKQKGNLLITGSHGTGKTLIMNLLLKEKGYKIYYFSNFNNKSKVDITLLEKLTTNNNKIALVIDDLESIIILNDRKSTSNIITDNNFKRTLPVIILTNNQHNKQLNDIKKYSDEIKIYPPYDNEITAWLTKICIKESIRFDYGIMQEFIIH
jgi:DNA polymerase III delta prime subunit